MAAGKATMTRMTGIMTCYSTPLPLVCGISFTDSQITPAPTSLLNVLESPAPATATNPLERLAQLMHSNDSLMEELAASRSRIADARANLDRPGSNARFGEAHLDRCRVKHSRILAQLRANRIETLQILDTRNSRD